MSEVFIPLGGAGGKNRGGVAIVGADATIQDMYGMVTVPLPAGNYKKYVANGEAYMPGYGDGKNAVLGLNKEFIKKAALHAFGIASITNFSLSMYAHKQVRLTWARPSQGLWSGVHFVFKYDSMPTSVTDGFHTLDSADVHFETGRLEERQLYVRAYNYVTTNEGRWYDNGAVSSTIRVSGISGAVSFGAGAGTWTVPVNVYKIRYILVGHGGQGGYPDGVGSGGGGGGGYFTTGYMDVTPGQSIPWVVPSQAPSYNNSYNTTREYPSYNTIFGSASASYGRIGTPWANYDRDSPGGNGGSGGGGPCLNTGGAGAPGGSNGSDGVHGVNTSRRNHTSYARGGTGQHTSTLGFNGVLYCGGGGGGGADGGAGGGGNGWKYDKNQRFQNGDSGTDGLGGGGGGGRDRDSKGGQGGTGCIYIAWGSSMNDGS